MSDSDDHGEAIGEMILDQIKQQGCGCVRVNDGQIFVFTREKIEELLARAIENADDGLVMIFVKQGPSA